MACKVCGSEKLERFPSEVNIHPPRGVHLSSPCVFAFPELLVCLDCGFTLFVLKESERSELTQHHGVERLAAGQPREADESGARRNAASKVN